MNPKRTVLIVDDNAVNRKILVKILCDEYTVSQADNGKQALYILEAHSSSISAILLDIKMPVMDGFEFLDAIKSVSKYSKIPVIVLTGDASVEDEKQALARGAWDFVPKPFDGTILLFRLKNAIERSELAALRKLRYVLDYDGITGIFNKNRFFADTKKMILANEALSFALLRIDIDRFQLVNSYYGIKTGDALLKHMAGVIVEFAKKSMMGTYGRIEADTFACCVPAYELDKFESDINIMCEAIKNYEIDFNIVPSVGIYLTDGTVSDVNKMYDCANLAAKTIKGSYIKNFAFYERRMRDALETEQEIINDMDQAFAEGQFHVYLQPKYSLFSNKPAGAEALVRWLHPVKGMIPPSLFIPVFERNGTICKLDYYMWEKVCGLLRGWIDAGMNPSPISVNVSRVNLYSTKLVDNISALTEHYGIPNSLLHLELTESAYTEDPEMMKDIMNRLHDKGFIVLMDDFGSGYSSLNVLKEIPVDVLKIDMRFLSDTEIPGRGENIIAAIVRMAKWLDIPTIAEGVEKACQIDFLRGIGCEFVQGYAFAKPMPVKDYEKLAIEAKVAEPEKNETDFDKDSLWNMNQQMEIMFSNIMQPIAVFEFDGKHAEEIRVNNAFYDVFGYENSVNSQDAMSFVDDRYKGVVLDAFQTAIDKKDGTSECEYLRHHLSSEGTRWVHLKLKHVSDVGNKHIIFGSFNDITDQKLLDLELQRYRLTNKEQSSLKMLIVDDGAVNRTILKRIFEDRFVIMEASDGKEALMKLRECEGNCDIILLDLMMPVMDGPSFLASKRAYAELSGIPVVVITSDDAPEQQVAMLELGASDYIVKPFVAKTIARRIDNVLESKRIITEK